MSSVAAGDRDHGVLLGQHEAELAERAVAAVGRAGTARTGSRSPAPSRCFGLLPLDVCVPGGLLDPLLGHELRPCPLPFCR